MQIGSAYKLVTLLLNTALRIRHLLLKLVRLHAKDRKPLFTGFIEEGMHKELLRLASVFRQIEEQKDE